MQVDEYRKARRKFQAPDEDVMVMHTLTVSPDEGRRGYGRAFMSFYESYAAEQGCRTLRIDTNAKNRAARKMYAGLRFREAGIVPCVFNDISGVQLVLLERKYQRITC